MDATRPGFREIGAPVLRHLRNRSVVSRDFGGSRQRSRFERHRGFRKRNTVREELQQCDGFQTDDRRGLCDGREITSFKGYYRDSSGKDVVLRRSFVQFDGEGDTANARQRAIGGHPAVLLRGVCLRKDPDSPYANHDGYVPFGKLVDYSGGRSNGCTSWSASDAGQIIPMMKDKPTTLYIYPEFRRHRRRRASGEGRPVAIARGIILERLLLERNPLSEILAKRNPRADPRSIQEGSSGTTAAADADLQVA